MRDGWRVKLKNRRVSMWREDDGGWCMWFAKLEGRKVVRTNLRLTNEAMCAVVELYMRLSMEDECYNEPAGSKKVSSARYARTR